MLRLPVSLGEAIDKMTILEIKYEKINDEKKSIQVNKEFTILQSELEPYMKKCTRHYRQLLKINQELWNLEEEIRTELTIEDCAKVALQIIAENDSRFRTKDKINKLLSSELKEQKAYVFESVKEISFNEIVNKHNWNADNIIDDILDSSVRNNRIKVIRREMNDESRDIFETVRLFFNYDDNVVFL
jgi:hypothetical protein